ncbi:MAG: AAA family ATPase [Nocardioidaceae bacterium]
MVTGVPGSGKTTLASALAPELGAPLLSLDAIKDALYGAGGEPRAAFELRLAAEAALVTQLDPVACPAVVDIWIAPQRDTKRVKQLLLPHADDLVELLCRVPADVAVRRYAARRRDPPHLPPDEPTLQRIRQAVDLLEPMGIGRCIEIDTTGPVEMAELTRWLRGRHNGGGPSRHGG